MPDAPAAESRTARQADRRAQRNRHRKRIALFTSGGLVLVVILIIAAAAGFLLYENGRIHRVHVTHLAGVQTTGDQKDAENILLIGSTTRCGLTQQKSAYGLCDEGVTGVNSDVVMILHLDPDHHRAAILSIPRDTFVPNAHPGGVNKIDAALGAPQGPGQLIAAITDDFGIPIQHYVELNFDSFQGVVNALGGIKMYFPMPVYDQQSNLHITATGCQALTGNVALQVVRARHLQYQPPDDVRVPDYDWPYDPQSDLSRIRRDHEFLRVLAAAVAKRGLGDPVTDGQLINSLAGNLEVDQGFSSSNMAGLVGEFHSVHPYAIPQYTLPVVEDGQTYYYGGGDYGDVVFPVQPEDSQVVAKFLGAKSNEDTTGKVLPAPGSFTLAVENGTGLAEQGAKTATALEALGYDVTSVGNTVAPATTTEATVLYSNRSQLDDALAVQSALSGLAVVGYDPGVTSASSTASTTASTIDVGSPPSQSADVILVTGSNFSVNAPAASPTTSSTSAPTTTATGAAGTTGQTGPGATALNDNPNLAAPSSSTENLEPWDPRSCTASGGEGP